MVEGTKSSNDCICKKGSYASNASDICQGCCAFKTIDKEAHVQHTSASSLQL